MKPLPAGVFSLNKVKYEILEIMNEKNLLNYLKFIATLPLL